MSYQEYLSEMKDIQIKLLDFIDQDENYEENYENLLRIISDKSLLNNRQLIKSFLYLISKISKNHHRGPKFWDKIKQILLYFKDHIKNNFSNIEIFQIFKSNKIIILHLIQEEILIIDEELFNKIKNYKDDYIQFFIPEFESFNLQEKIQVNDDYKNNSTEYKEKRNIGENDHYICKLIREDSIDEFTSNLTQKNISIDFKIEPSIYETNSLLIKNKQITLIEYASFFGSIQIFKYLFSSKINLTPSLWIFAIHSNNLEIIKILEENKIVPKDKTYEECLKEAIKCHHHKISDYILENLINEKIEQLNQKINFENNQFSFAFHYYNFLYFPNELDNQFILNYACIYDYLLIVEYFLKTKESNFKQTSIFTFIFIQSENSFL